MTQPAQPQSQREIEASIGALLDTELSAEDSTRKRTGPGGEVVEEEIDDDPGTEPVEDDEVAADEGDDDDSEGTEDAEPGEGEGESSDDTEDEGISTLDDLSASFEMDQDEFLSAIKVDDAGTTLAQLVEAHTKSPQNALLTQQIEADSARVLEEKTALTKQREEYAETSQKSVERLAVAADHLLTEVEGERGTDWEKLKLEDPQDYMLRFSDHQLKKQKIEEALTLIRAEADKQSETDQQIRADFARDQQAKLYEKMPEWRKDPVRAEAFKGIETSLRAAGFEDDDFAMLDDHRILLQAYKAAQWDELQHKGKLVKKRIKKVQKKVVRAGARRNSEQDKSRQQRVALRKRLRASGSVEDAAALMGDLV